MALAGPEVLLQVWQCLPVAGVTAAPAVTILKVLMLLPPTAHGKEKWTLSVVKQFAGCKRELLCLSTGHWYLQNQASSLK